MAEPFTTDERAHVRQSEDRHRRNLRCVAMLNRKLWPSGGEGIAMLSGVLSSPRAIAVNIEIMRAFVVLRRALALNDEI